jgi:hypothetical protein
MRLPQVTLRSALVGVSLLGIALGGLTCGMRHIEAIKRDTRERLYLHLEEAALRRVDELERSPIEESREDLIRRAARLKVAREHVEEIRQRAREVLK